MPAAIDPVIKKQVVKQWLLGDSRDRIAADNGIGAGAVSNIIDDFKKGVQDSDFSSARELAIHGKKEGVDLRDLLSVSHNQNDRLYEPSSHCVICSSLLSQYF